jgi:LPXTG-motif cell wall-anchored protein
MTLLRYVSLGNGRPDFGITMLIFGILGVIFFAALFFVMKKKK